jgi:hypothetical protein
MACIPAAPGALPAPCGRVREGAWSVRLGPGEQADRVLAQLSLSIRP